MLTHGSLFSGIGGFDLAAQWAGWHNTFQVELDPWCQRILTKNFPNVERHTDIRTFDPAPYADTVDVLSGGFPCQPYSQAGQRKGTDDPRHLWPEMLRVIRTIQPRWVVGENVRGLVNWSGGMVFEQVCLDLESAGYTVQPFIFPAASVNAPHERQRVWFVAHTTRLSEREQANEIKPFTNSGQTRTQSCSSSQPHPHPNHQRQQQPQRPDHKERRWPDHMGKKDSTDPHRQRCSQLHPPTLPERPRRISGHHFDIWHKWTTQPPVCRMDDGIPHRVDRIRGLGNAIVPQLAFRIFDAINQYEALTHHS